MSKDKSGNWFKRHKIITGIIVLLTIIGVASGGSSPSSNTPAAKTTVASKPAPKKASATLATVEQPARDGKFEFIVNGVKCGETQIGDDVLNTTAQGQFCRLNVTVKNIADQSQSLDSDSQYLFNAKGQKYSSDSTATLYAAPDSSSWYTDINPGNSVTGDIIFDIPKDQVPATAELHDSAFSGGVKVKLQ